MPEVSVIIPNYNHAPFLKERIDSVLQQTYTDFEVIILDDKSSDNSKEIIEGYRGHQKISHIIYNEENSGSTFKQWIKGIELAKGNWIWIAESDDVAEIDFLSSVVSQITGNISLIFCQSTIINDEGIEDHFLGQRLYPNKKFWEGFQGITQELNGQQFAVYHMYQFNQIVNASSVLFQKNLATLDGELLSYKLCGDWYFWLSLLKNGDAIYIHKVLNHFRKHTGTVRHSSDLKMFTYFENAKIIHFLLDNFDISNDLKKRYLDYLIYIFNHRYQKDVRKQYVKEYRKTLHPFGPQGYFQDLKFRLLNA